MPPWLHSTGLRPAGRDLCWRRPQSRRASHGGMSFSESSLQDYLSTFGHLWNDWMLHWLVSPSANTQHLFSSPDCVAWRGQALFVCRTVTKLDLGTDSDSAWTNLTDSLYYFDTKWMNRFCSHSWFPMFFPPEAIKQLLKVNTEISDTANMINLSFSVIFSSQSSKQVKLKFGLVLIVDHFSVTCWASRAVWSR